MTSDPNYPTDLSYHEAHDWVRIKSGNGAEDREGTCGITWFGQDALGEIVFVELPSVGDRLEADRPYAEVESVKSVSDVVAPMSGEIIEVNFALEGDPSAINADPYGAGWLVRVRLGDPSERENLLDAAAYRAELE